MLDISFSPKRLPSCSRAMILTASGKVATEPSWKYGGVTHGH